MKIVVPDHLDLAEHHKTELQTLGEVTLYDDTNNDEDEIISRIKEAELILVSWVDITERIIKNAHNLRYIIVTAVGYDNINIKAATEAGIKVINCPTHNALSVAEYTIGFIITIARRILESNLALRNGIWSQEQFKGTELRGKTLTLIGHGTIAKHVESLAKGFGLKVNYATSKTSLSQLDELIANADIISLHLPLTEQTKHLIDARRLNLMKPTAYLINTARGAIIDQKALIQALQSGKLAGAALDVFENEPVGTTPSEEIMELLHMNNVVATSHIAYNTEEMLLRLGDELLGNIQACITGKLINVVN